MSGRPFALSLSKGEHDFCKSLMFKANAQGGLLLIRTFSPEPP